MLANNSGRNFGTASAGIANNAANMYRAMGDQMIKSEMANRTHEGEVFKANDAVNQGNSELLLKAAIADSEAYANAARTNAELLKGAYDYKYKIEKDRGDAISAGISGLASNLYNNSQAQYNNDLIRWGFKSGAVGAKGGPIRRKRRGLNF
jgi:hypothetical protein